MKKQLLFLVMSALIVLLFGCETMEYHEGPLPEPQKIVQLDDQSATDIFSRTLLWATDSFVSAKSAIELQDKDSGLITIRTGFDSTSYKLGLAAGGRYYLIYKIKVEIQDEKARITCHSPIVEISGSASGTMSTLMVGMVTEYTNAADETISSYEQYMSSSQDNW